MVGTTPKMGDRSQAGPSAETPSINNEQIFYPKQRLAAATRVANEIVELMPNIAENEDRIESLITKFRTKYLVFLELCDEEASKEADAVAKERFREWYDDKKAELSQLESGFGTALENHRMANVGDSASMVSERSSASSIRAKLAEKKARLLTEKKYFAESLKLEKEQIALQNSLKELQLRKEEDECKHLEEAIQSETGARPKFTTESKCKLSLNNDEDSSQNSILLKLLEAQQRSFLPKQFPEKFDGSDVTKYRKFKLSFSQMIENYCDADSKFHYLLQYTEGYAHELVSSCHSDDARRSFDRAFSTLERKYGDDYVLAQAYLSKLKSWPQIQYDDGKSLEKLSLFLTSCLNIMEEVSDLGQLNNHEEIKMIIDKLPLDVRKSWRKYAVNLMEEGRRVKFSNLETFVSKQSRILNSPIFGNVRSESSREQKSIGKHRVMATVAEDVSGEVVCMCCTKVGHCLDSCFFFKKKNFDEKRKFVRDRNLCYGCLSSDHFFADCPDKIICKICNMQHPTSMHKDTALYKPVAQNNSDKAVVMSVKSKFNCFSTPKQARMLSPAVPVLVKLRAQRKWYVPTWLWTVGRRTASFRQNCCRNWRGPVKQTGWSSLLWVTYLQ